MIATRAQLVFQRMDQLELNLCVWLNRSCQRNGIKSLFSLISRLGDGIFWYSLMLMLPFIYGVEAIYVSLHMALVAVLGLAIYKLLKTRLLRERPFFTHANIMLGTAPLDKYSFPSGHTLHAVAFTIILGFYFPSLGLMLIPFSLLIAMSRVVLGLHYPTDVLAGAAIGTALAVASLYFI